MNRAMFQARKKCRCISLDPEAWTGEDCLIYYTVTNKTDKLVYYDLQIRSVNDECMDYDWEATNWWYLDPGRENMEICANNCNGIMPYKAGRDPMTRAKNRARGLYRRRTGRADPAGS